ncbi:GFA family protein [Rhizobium sp. BG4]|uniref:GFA family protein n=1 Tax=Rhizobium sp. BG4 TaxID=2613770 RepID=UPI0032B258B8
MPITSGNPKEYVKLAANGLRGMQYCCGLCGSPIFITAEMEDAEQVGIRLGTINPRRNLEPAAQFWFSSCFRGLKISASYQGTPNEVWLRRRRRQTKGLRLFTTFEPRWVFSEQSGAS